MNINYALILLVVCVVTGIVWTWDKLSLRKKRWLNAQLAVKTFEEGQAPSIRNLDGEQAVEEARAKIQQKALKAPWWVEYSVSFFPVVLFVFCLRSFVVEPFRIPSGSMIPTLHVGDLILVNKFKYGVRLPISNQQIIPVSDPQRGDVMVFQYPGDTSQDYIKRVIGVPGDTISYRNKRLTINGVPVPTTVLRDDYYDLDRIAYATLLQESIDGRTHQLLNDDSQDIKATPIFDFPYRDQCRYMDDGVVCKVPEGHYFMLGDNRDYSLDSRFWGFVPEQNIVGQAFFIWMNFGDLSRIGSIN